MRWLMMPTPQIFQRINEVLRALRNFLPKIALIGCYSILLHGVPLCFSRLFFLITLSYHTIGKKYTAVLSTWDIRSENSHHKHENTRTNYLTQEITFDRIYNILFAQTK